MTSVRYENRVHEESVLVTIHFVGSSIETLSYYCYFHGEDGRMKSKERK